MQDKPSRFFFSAMTILLFVLAAYNLISTARMGLTTDEILAYMPIMKAFAGGDKIYTTLIDHQSPGLFFAGAPFIWIFGSTVLAAKATVIFYTLLFIIAVANIAYTFSGSLHSGILSSAFAAFFASSFALWFGVNVHPMSGILVVVGLGAAVNVARSKHKAIWALLGGLLVGVGFVTTLTTLVELPALLWLVYLAKRQWRWPGLFLSGIIGAVLLICVYFALTGTFNEMFFVSVTNNLFYGGLTSSAGNPRTTLAIRLGYVSAYLLPQTLPFLSTVVISALVAFFWNIVHKRTAILAAMTLWILLSVIASAAPESFSLHYFFHVVAPLSILATFSLNLLLKIRLVRLCYLIAAVLLLIPVTRPVAINGSVFPDSYSAYASDYAASIAFLNKNLDKRDCILPWGESLSGVIYFTDYKFCTRAFIGATMMISEAYDIRQMRAWYLSDLLASKPKLLARQYTWGFFPQLERLATYHVGPQVFVDSRLNASYFKMDWSTYSESNGNVNHEIDLKGYDLIPGRTVMPGQQITVVLYWDAVKPPSTEYQGFVHLVSADLQSALVSVDNLPTDPYISTAAWTLPGEIIVGRPYTLTIPPGAQPGEYTLITGMYNLAPGGNHPNVEHFDRITQKPVPFISLGTIIVKAPSKPSDQAVWTF